MSLTVEDLVSQFSLLPHPEGGFYRETYRSELAAVPPNGSAERNYSTAIYFLLTEGNFSAFHRIKSDEVWHHYTGASIVVHIIDQDGNYRQIKLGKAFELGEVPQAVVKAGEWFASEAIGEFGLVGCTVSPGFDFADFVLAERAVLISQFPQHKKIIERLTRI